MTPIVVPTPNHVIKTHAYFAYVKIFKKGSLKQTDITNVTREGLEDLEEVAKLLQHASVSKKTPGKSKFFLFS
jgi:hypothetical protein